MTGFMEVDENFCENLEKTENNMDYNLTTQEKTNNFFITNEGTLTLKHSDQNKTGNFTSSSNINLQNSVYEPKNIKTNFKSLTTRDT